uniref:Uncharacterized protein n=1 Tax=Zeugodacus cucurbitae TaxID=28588 RepID=A0A0A1WT44_ZEUCU
MYCKVALVFLLGLTVINASVIARVNYPTYQSEALRDLHLPLGVEEPSRHLLPPFEDYGGARLYSNGIFRSVQPDGQLPNERQEIDKQFEPQQYPYDVVNRILPKVQEPTDFQPLDQQITQVSDNVKNTQQTVNDFENYLEGVAAALAPQNKPKNGVLRVTMDMAPKLGEVPISSLAEKDFADSVSSILVGDTPTDSESAEVDKELDKFLSSLFGEIPNERESANKHQEFVNVVQNKNLGTFDDNIIEEDSAKYEKELEDLLSSMMEEKSGSSNKDQEFIDFLQKILEEDNAKSEKDILGSFDRDVLEEEEKELDHFPSSMTEEDSTDNNSSKQEQEFENILQKILEEDIANNKKRFENPNSFDENIFEKEEKDLENLLSSMIEADIANNKKEWEDSANNEKDLENLLSSILREDNTDSNNAKDLSQKVDKHNDDEEKIDESLDSYLNKIFAAEARVVEEEEKGEEIEQASADSFDEDLEELERNNYLNSIFASSPTLNGDYFIR